MGHYVLTERIAKNLRARQYALVCKICDCPLNIGDDVESKQQRRGKAKLYHKKCYEASHIDVGNGETDKEIEDFFAKDA